MVPSGCGAGAAAAATATAAAAASAAAATTIDFSQEGVDGFVWELPGVGGTVDSLSAGVRTLLTALSEADPAGYRCMGTMRAHSIPYRTVPHHIASHRTKLPRHATSRQATSHHATPRHDTAPRIDTLYHTPYHTTPH